MKKRFILSITVLLIAVLFFGLSEFRNREIHEGQTLSVFEESVIRDEGGPALEPHPLSIETLRQGEYSGSEIVIEQTLSHGSNYSRYIASHKSEGLKIFGLLTIPDGTPPDSGWPAIVFNHGYISPSVYRTTEKYVAYQDAFARNGYVTFKSDYRGHGNSEGDARGGYGANDYTIDVLNALASVQKLEEVNPDKIGMWGHSMGGHITLESMVVNTDIKAGVIWAGVVGSYEDLFERWRRRSGPTPTPNPNSQRGRWRRELSELFGDPSENPEFWNSLSATSYLDDISGPVQLHHGTADSSVEVEQSTGLEQRLKDADKPVELFVYEGDDHNISSNLSLALSRSVAFFDKYLKD